ncbi:GNAT family N-acetyltransferase [Thermodesulfobacteriota bacterium]
MVNIREEHPDDIRGVHDVNTKAFRQPQEADLVDNLRRNCDQLLSLVAVVREEIVGHILFSPVLLEGNTGVIRGMGLAPMAVLPSYQRQGIGSDLVESGIAELTNRRCPFIIVLGHADYYPRFGFEPASRYDIRSEWEVPDEAFMIKILNKQDMQGISGIIKYRAEFSAAL